LKILVTGNLGYIGPTLTSHLEKSIKDVQILGYDTGFFQNCITGNLISPNFGISRQYYGDIRDINLDILDGIDAVIHLAAISNDPLGKEFSKVTMEINHAATIKLAKLSLKSGVKNFVFASSCSVYGIAQQGDRKETDPTNPLSTYAESKLAVEKDVKNTDLENMTFTSLRFATACGWSNRLRLDLVLNDFVASALTRGEVTLLSDGTAWRPLIDVEDMSRALAWASLRKKSEGGQYLCVNAGSNNSNYQVKELAHAVAKVIDGTKISIHEAALPDKRSYKVDFTLFENLAGSFLPKVNLFNSIENLKNGLIGFNFENKDFRKSSLIRLNIVKKLIQAGRIDKSLRWK